VCVYVCVRVKERENALLSDREQGKERERERNGRKEKDYLTSATFLNAAVNVDGGGGGDHCNYETISHI